MQCGVSKPTSSKHDRMCTTASFSKASHDKETVEVTGAKIDASGITEVRLDVDSLK